jgi:hypothetical protein
MQNAVGLFDFPPGGLPCFVRHIGLQEFQELHGGAHWPPAPEPPASLSVGLAWTVTRRMERPDLLHDGLRAKWHAAAL